MRLPNPLETTWPLSLVFVGIVLKDEIQASNYENCTLKQKVDMLEYNNRVQHNATQGCNQPPADTIVHWRNGWPGIGDVLSGTLNSWVRMVDNIVLLCKYIQTSELLPEKFSKWVPTYIDVPYIRDLRVCDLGIVKNACYVLYFCFKWLMCVMTNAPSIPFASDQAATRQSTASQVCSTFT